MKPKRNVVCCLGIPNSKTRRLYEQFIFIKTSISKMTKILLDSLGALKKKTQLRRTGMK